MQSNEEKIVLQSKIFDMMSIDYVFWAREASKRKHGNSTRIAFGSLRETSTFVIRTSFPLHA